MGKATKWFRGLFGLKKSSSSTTNDTDRQNINNKRRWSFVKSYREKDQHQQHRQDYLNDNPKPVVSSAPPDKNDTEKHAIAVAATSAAAAVVSAQAAVVRLTSRAAAVGIREDWAAVKIQSAFRGSLARKALRALKGLVKLQALVRGHIERKRTAEWLHRMQVLMQAQARAIVGRSELAKPINPYLHPGPSTPEKVEHVIRSRSRKYEQSSLLRKNSSRRVKSEEHVHERSGNLRHFPLRNNDDDKIDDRIVEIDKPHIIITPKRLRNISHSNESFSASKESSSHEVRSPLTPLKLVSVSAGNVGVEEASFCTADNSPQFYSANSSRGGHSGSRRSPFTPSKSDGATSFFLGGYSDCPSYMSCTESSKAKVRSLSAPRQRPTAHYERSSSTKRGSISGGQGGQKISALHANFMNKAYPGSGRLDKLGMPIGYRC